MPQSYIKFLVLAVTGWDVNDDLVDAAAVAAFLGIFTLAVSLAVAKSHRNSLS